MANKPTYTNAGTEIDKISVRLSYRIVSLFSEGLYASPNKAIEELVANSFDAGALNVAVFLPVDFHEQGSTIAVLDDGEGMDAIGLKQHWIIGRSIKRKLDSLPLNRQQIGKFGIGKLATYVLANHLSHMSKRAGKYYSTTMNYGLVDNRKDDGEKTESPIKISLRELSVAQAKEVLAPWISTDNFKNLNFKLFGTGAEKSWTFAILSDLKPKVHQIRPGTLNWVLRTALPLRDDFAVYLNGDKLTPSKAEKGLIKKWIVGKDIKDLPKPALGMVSISEDTSQQKTSATRYALEHETVGRITGYVEIYRDLITGKSDEIARSHGFFVYVRGRLINVEDGHFGIQPDELRHGTFGRCRVVVNMDGLDAHLQSDREHIRQGPVLTDAQNVLRAIFNKVRAELVKADAEEEPGAKLARKFAGSPPSVSRRPIIEMVRAALNGKIKSRYIALPHAATESEREALIQKLETLATTPEQFIGGIDFTYDVTSDERIAAYDAVSTRLKINGLHPFVGAFFDEFTNKISGLPLEVFAMAEILLESHLYQARLKQDEIDQVMDARDQLLRSVAQESGRRTALTVANALRNARNDKDKLEKEVVEAFRSLGFDATGIGGNGKPDGVAKAHLSAGPGNQPRRYAVTLEAKSKEKDNTKVSTKTVGISTVVRHRNDMQCEHAIVVAPAFEHAKGDTKSALSKEIVADRNSTAQAGKPRTITAIHIEDLARLVQLRPAKRLGLERIRELLQKCSLPEECKDWVDSIEKEHVDKPPYAQIINAIYALQQEFCMAAVEYSALRVYLKKDDPPYAVQTNEEIMELCKAMAAMVSSDEMSATERTVELNQSPANVLAAIESATKSTVAGAPTTRN